jgi:hypothetical protein
MFFVCPESTLFKRMQPIFQKEADKKNSERRVRSHKQVTRVLSAGYMSAPEGLNLTISCQ